MSNLGAEKILASSVRASISQMTEHDLLEVVVIEETSGLSRWGWEAYYGELARKTETIMLVARPLDDECDVNGCAVLGFIAARIMADELHINNMAVRDEWRQAGIGSQLLGAALKDAKRLGARRSFLEVRASNEAAHALYCKFGFSANGRRANYYADPTEDALIMTALLL